MNHKRINHFPASRLILALAVALALAPIAAAAAPDATLTMEAVNDASMSTVVESGADAAATLRAQVLLDRARISPGEIDGRWGTNTRRAVTEFQRNKGLETSGRVDERTWEALNSDTAPVLVEYTITEEDVAGPFTDIPSGMEAKAKLERLGYASATEALGEKFHARPKLLQQLNPDADFSAGSTIVVPKVADAELPKAAKVVVDESDGAVRLLDADGAVYAYFPATTGSENDPLPVGEWKINGVAMDPTFHYNPELFWDSDPSDAKATIPPGPNNPVGVVWVDLSKEHYGIHGTPEPSLIGKTASHGCIRLTNWSAKALASAVSPGVVALLQK